MTYYIYVNHKPYVVETFEQLAQAERVLILAEIPSAQVMKTSLTPSQLLGGGDDSDATYEKREVFARTLEPFTWTAKITVAGLWVQDGLDLGNIDDPRATPGLQEALLRAYGHLNSDEITVEMIATPDPARIKAAQSGVVPDAPGSPIYQFTDSWIPMRRIEDEDDDDRG